MTSSNGNIFRITGHLCGEFPGPQWAGNSPVPSEFPAQRPVTRSFDVFFDLRLNKRLNKQSWGWHPLWRHRNGELDNYLVITCTTQSYYLDQQWLFMNWFWKKWPSHLRAKSLKIRLSTLCIISTINASKSGSNLWFIMRNLTLLLTDINFNPSMDK